jgi:hypothetical protein
MSSVARKCPFASPFSPMLSGFLAVSDLVSCRLWIERRCDSLMFLRIDCIVCDLALIAYLTRVYPGFSARNAKLWDRYLVLTLHTRAITESDNSRRSIKGGDVRTCCDTDKNSWCQWGSSGASGVDDHAGSDALVVMSSGRLLPPSVMPALLCSARLGSAPARPGDPSDGTSLAP